MFQFDLKQPCGVCPFRRDSAAGYLGSYTPESVLSDIRYEVPFLCHQQVAAEVGYEDDWLERAEQAGASHCAGSLIYARKSCKLPRDAAHAAAVAAIDSSQDILFPASEFLAHHKGPFQ